MSSLSIPTETLISNVLMAVVSLWPFNNLPTKLQEVRSLQSLEAKVVIVEVLIINYLAVQTSSVLKYNSVWSHMRGDLHPGFFSPTGLMKPPPSGSSKLVRLDRKPVKTSQIQI